MVQNTRNSYEMSVYCINEEVHCFMVYEVLSKKNQKTLACLLLGSIVLAVGINLFIAPNNLAFGGVTGMTILIQSLTGIPIFVSNFILSFIVILLGWCELGREFMIKTIIPTVVLPFFLYLTAPLGKYTISLPVSAVMGAVTVGVGVGLTIFAGGSTAGPDTIGIVLKKRLNIPITLTMLLIDILVIICGFSIYGVKVAAWSIGVAVLMNITVKCMRNILSQDIIFRYWHNTTCDKVLEFKS